MFELLHAADVSEVQSVGEVHQALVQYSAARHETPVKVYSFTSGTSKEYPAESRLLGKEFRKT